MEILHHPFFIRFPLNFNSTMVYQCCDSNEILGACAFRQYQMNRYIFALCDIIFVLAFFPSRCDIRAVVETIFISHLSLFVANTTVCSHFIY